MGYQRYIRLVLFMGFAVSQIACSTPPIVEQTPQQETAWEAYMACLESLRGASANSCDNVGASGSYSYNQYTGSYGSGGGRFRGVAFSKSVFDQAYRDYLESLSASDSAQLIAQWREIAASSEVAP